MTIDLSPSNHATGNDSQQVTWSHYPVGPMMQKWLVRQGFHTPISQDNGFVDSEAFSRGFLLHATGLSQHEVHDFVDELVTMDLPQTALDLADQYPDYVCEPDFRLAMALGLAYMLTAQYDPAMTFFIQAHKLLPNEPAPYTNMTQILMELGDIENAKVWVLQGIETEPNHPPLWELLWNILEEEGSFDAQEFLSFAQTKGSWTGMSLGVELLGQGDRHLLSSLLQKIYEQGERSGDFLVEYTGALGVATEFEKIPPILWQARGLTTERLPWQLLIHGAQAHEALGQSDLALKEIEAALFHPEIPEGVKKSLQEFKAELLEDSFAR